MSSSANGVGMDTRGCTYESTLTLMLQGFVHLMQRTDSLEKNLMLERLKAGGEGDTEDEIVGWHHRLDG